MTRCMRCYRFLLFSSQSGYCADCEIIVEKEIEAKRKAEEKRKRQEEKARREAEAERKRIEEEKRHKAEQERLATEYKKAITLFSMTTTIEEVETIKQTFVDLRGFKDAEEWIGNCDGRIRFLKETDERNRLEEEERQKKAEEEQKKAEEKLKKEIELVKSRYSIGDVVYWGQYRSWEHIKWHLVDIDGINGLLISDEILDSQKFHSVNNKSIVITWEMSDLRKWMNKTMLDEMFTAKEKKSIILSRIANGNYCGKTFANTFDQLFLLSLAELEKYECKDYLADYEEGWWLRTKGEDLCGSSVGTLYVGKFSENDLSWINTLGSNWIQGVRPALWVNLSTAILISEDEMERIRKEEEERQRKEEEERQRKAEEEQQRKQEEERRRKEEQEREEEQKRKEEEQRRKEEKERIRKEKELLRNRLKEALIHKETEKQFREKEEQLYREEEEKARQEAESWVKTQDEERSQIIEKLKSSEADMQPYSFAGSKVSSKKAFVYALNDNWEDAKKHMNRGLILEHFKRDFDADIISNLMDIDEDSSTDDQDIKLLRYLYAIDTQLGELLWKANVYKGVSDFGLQYLSAIKYNKLSLIEAADEIIEKDILRYYLERTEPSDDELISRIADFKTYLEEIKTGKEEDCRVKRCLLAYSLVKNDDAAIPVLYSILLQEKRKAASLPLTERKKEFTKVLEAFTLIGSYEDSAAICQMCQEQINETDKLLNKYPIGATITFGRFWQGRDQSEGKTDLEWVVLDVQQSKALLISKYVIYALPYAKSRGLGFSGDEWSKSIIRQWLNSNFCEYAFNLEEQTTILLSDVDNSAKQHNFSMKRNVDKYAGEDTKDRVFVLSYAEACKYFPTDQSRKCYETEYAYNDTKQYGAGPAQRGLIWWWLRSPGYLNNGAPIIDENGKFDLDNVSDISGGIRPALWVDIDPDYECLREEYPESFLVLDKNSEPRISEEATKKAQDILMGDLGEARLFAMTMNMNMRTPDADYFSLKRCIISALMNDGSMSPKEIDSIDFDQILLPFVAEIDSDDDMHIRQVKSGVMKVIRSHR